MMNSEKATFAVFSYPQNGSYQDTVRAQNLDPNHWYLVDNIQVGPCSSVVQLIGSPAQYNTAQFDFYDESKEPVDIYSMDAYRNY